MTKLFGDNLQRRITASFAATFADDMLPLVALEISKTPRQPSGSLGANSAAIRAISKAPA